MKEKEICHECHHAVSTVHAGLVIMGEKRMFFHPRCLDEWFKRNYVMDATDHLQRKKES